MRGSVTGAAVPVVPVDSPYGCVVAKYLASEADIQGVVSSGRSAPNVRGDAPRVVAGQRNTALYNAHSYHTKVPPEAIVPFLKHFSRRGDVVLDPFCGTGTTGKVAKKLGRRFIGYDVGWLDE